MNFTTATTVADAASAFALSGISAIPIHYPLGPDECTCGATPCVRGVGKHPATPGGEWLAYTKRIATADEREQWFGAGQARNVAVICGQVSDGLTVIDCDDATTYAAFCYAYRELRDTLTVRTGKGYHLYCIAPEPLKTVTFEANGLRHHVKAEGGYVVAPPSRHRSGNVYAWVDPDAAPLMLDLARLRAALARMGASRKADPQSQSRHEQGWAATLLRDGSRFGHRDDDTIALAGYLKRYVPRDTAEAIMELWLPRCDSRPGDEWGIAQVMAKLDSAWRYQDETTQQTP